MDRAVRILAVLGSGPPRLGVTEIADRVGLAKPTVHGLLRTLEQHDLVAQDPDTGKYSLGPGVVSLGNSFLGGSELRARSLRWTEVLARKAGEAVWVATLSGPRVIVLHHVFRPDDTVQILEVGATIPWHACALGHAIVAHQPAPEQARALASDLVPLTGRTRTTKAALRRALAQVRRQGLAVEDQEATVGDAGIAAPIFGRDSVAGAVGVVGAADRLLIPAAGQPDLDRPDAVRPEAARADTAGPSGARPDLARAVQEAARAISRDLGAGRGSPLGPVLSALS
ncbi:MAG TPA: IclR family transcriptional regulator [Streptosporangiaceae bacterium]|nr:IclR family transcriptional regulator [Streptosporangiaceae bacterium]